MREVRALSRVGRENQIIIALAHRIQNAQGNGATAYKIASIIDMRPTSPRFRSIIRVMVEKGLLIEEIMNAPSKCVGGHLPKFYTLPLELCDKVRPQKRAVPVKVKGVSVGQLELF